MYSDFTWSEAAGFRNQLTRTYEPIQPFLLVEWARRLDPDLFVDVGANIGIYSLFLSKVKSLRMLHAFEPAPASHAMMAETLRANGLKDRVKLHQIAASNADGSVTFGIVSDLSGANSVVDTSIHPKDGFARTETVKTARLDDMLGVSDMTAIVKIDVEGHEAAVIEGARSFLTENRTLVQIETLGGGAEALEALGYQMLFQVGPDAYLSNMPDLDDPSLKVEVFEAASTAMIAANKAGPGDVKRPPGWQRALKKLGKQVGLVRG